MEIKNNTKTKMKNLKLLLLCLFLFVVLFSPFVPAQVIINEVEQNPSGTDAGNEWVELFSDSEINLDDWKLINNDNGSFELNGTFNGFFVIIFPKQWLDNSDEKVRLMNNETIIDETEIFSDSSNNDLTWSLCNDEWTFTTQSKNNSNNCEEEQEQEEEQGDEEQQENEQEEQQEAEEYEESIPQKEGINYYILEVPSAIKSGGEFNIKIEIENNKDYDQDFEIWSYIYRGPKCYSNEGNREENKKEISVLKKSSEIINSSGKVIENVESGEYKLKIKVLKSSLKTPEEFIFNITLEGIKDKIKSVENETKSILKEKSTIDNNKKEITGNTIYESKSEVTKITGLWLIAVLFGLIIIYLIIKKEN